MSIYITGDIHGENDVNRLSKKSWRSKCSVGYPKDGDFVIITGDFGLIWDTESSPVERYWLRWLDKQPWTTLFVDGNHENHFRLAELPTADKFGGLVGVVSDKVFHLRRGEIYTIDNRKILAFGGAMSTDKLHRKAGLSWWPQEIPSDAELEHAFNNIEKNDGRVDVIIAHTCPTSIASIVAYRIGYHYDRIEDPTAAMLERIINRCEFDRFYCGHWHTNLMIDNYRLIYRNIEIM